MFVGLESTPSVLKFGMPQGSVLGPLLFTLHTHPLSTVICQSDLSYHFFANDSQLHKSNAPSDFPVPSCCLKDCIEDIVQWMGDSKLKMNNKTELMATGTRFKLSQIIPNIPSSVSGCHIPFSLSVRNLGFYLDATRSIMHTLNTSAAFCFVTCAELEKVRSFLSTDAANKLAVSLILSRLDCNSLLAGIPDNKLSHAADLCSVSPGMQV